MSTIYTPRARAADRRAIMAALSLPENQGQPAAFINFEAKRARAHLIVHQGEGPTQNWMSQTMDAASFNKFRAELIAHGPLPEKKRNPRHETIRKRSAPTAPKPVLLLTWPDMKGAA
jgi:hypothetical protein